MIENYLANKYSGVGVEVGPGTSPVGDSIQKDNFMILAVDRVQFETKNERVRGQNWRRICSDIDNVDLGREGKLSFLICLFPNQDIRFGHKMAEFIRRHWSEDSKFPVLIATETSPIGTSLDFSQGFCERLKRYPSINNCLDISLISFEKYHRNFPQTFWSCELMSRERMNKPANICIFSVKSSSKNYTYEELRQVLKP